MVLEDAEREGADGVCGGHAAAVLFVDGDAVGGIGHIGDDGVELDAGVVRLEECRGFLRDNSAVTTLVPDKVVFIAELIKGQVGPGDPEDERAFIGRI